MTNTFSNLLHLSELTRTGILELVMVYNKPPYTILEV